ncbi:MAG: helix-turn-helix transcriptional regulator [Geothrix sp.]|jgi:transcriptional regulator with XRE-family HTH domain|nr:helix-turn-helix transcriptional regulator [Geothrix sp.]
MADIADRKAMGVRIKTLRKAKHWPQKQLAGALGIRFEQLNKYESGLNNPPVDMLVKLSEALDTTVDYLLTGAQIEDSQLANIRLFRRFQALERLGEEEQQTVMRVIDAMVAQHRVTSALAPVD